MSVPEGKRTKSKFEVIVKARNIVAHTIKITSNEKVFSKRYRWSFTGKLVDETVDMYKNLFFANSVRVVTKEDKILRRQYQVKALAQTYSILAMIQIAYDLFGLSTDRVKYWTELLMEEQKLIRDWRDSDSSRYRNL